MAQGSIIDEIIGIDTTAPAETPANPPKEANAPIQEFEKETPVELERPTEDTLTAEQRADAEDLATAEAEDKAIKDAENKKEEELEAATEADKGELTEDEQQRADKLIAKAKKAEEDNKEEKLNKEDIRELNQLGYDVEVDDGKPEEGSGEEGAEKPVEFNRTVTTDVVESYTGKLYNSQQEQDNDNNAIIIAARNQQIALNQAYQSDPHLQEVVNDVLAGKPFLPSVAAHYGAEGLIPQPGEEGHEDYLKIQWEREQRQQNEVSMQEHRQQLDQQNSQKMISFCQGKKMDQAGAQAFASKINLITRTLTQNMLVDPFLEMVYKDGLFDTAVAAAEVKGMNQKITITRAAQNGQGRIKKFTTKSGGKTPVRRPVKHTSEGAKFLDTILNDFVEST